MCVICGRQRAPGKVFLQVLLLVLSNIIPLILQSHLPLIKRRNNWHFSAVPRDVVELITDNRSAGLERALTLAGAFAEVKCMTKWKENMESEVLNLILTYSFFSICLLLQFIFSYLHWN